MRPLISFADEATTLRGIETDDLPRQSNRDLLRRYDSSVLTGELGCRDADPTPRVRKVVGFVLDNGCGDLLVLLPGDSTEAFGDRVYWFDHETGALQAVCG